MSTSEYQELFEIGKIISKGDKLVEKEIRKCLSDMDVYYEMCSSDLHYANGEFES